jgi:hypothetical protein
MNSDLNYLAVRQRVEDSRRAGERTMRARQTRAGSDHDRRLTIRPATWTDLAEIREIAALDSQRPPSAPVLLAEIDDQIVAAMALETGAVVANPFRHTERAVELLRVRAEQLTSARRRVRGSLRRLRIGRAVANPR